MNGRIYRQGGNYEYKEYSDRIDRRYAAFEAEEDGGALRRPRGDSGQGGAVQSGREHQGQSRLQYDNRSGEERQTEAGRNDNRAYERKYRSGTCYDSGGKRVQGYHGNAGEYERGKKKASGSAGS